MHSVEEPNQGVGPTGGSRSARFALDWLAAEAHGECMNGTSVMLLKPGNNSRFADQGQNSRNSFLLIKGWA
jgi:hypothetical protein